VEQPTVATEAAIVPVIPTECTHPNVVVGTQKGEKLTGVKDLRGVVLHLDGFVAETEDKAMERLDYHGIKATSATAVVGYLDSELDYRVYLKLAPDAGGEFIVFNKFSPIASISVDAVGGLTGDGRYAVLTSTQNFYERVPFCENGEEDEDDCATATGDDGDVTQFSVFDRTNGAHLFDAFDSRDKDTTCKPEPVAPVLRDGVFSFTACDGTVDSFTLSDLAPCTVEAREKRFAQEAEDDERTAQILAAEGGDESVLTAADKKKFINTARKLTKKKDYNAAIEMFTKVIDDDGSAITARSGRGYAFLMRATGDDLAAADSDFEAAFRSVTGTSPADAKLKAQIAHNRGLVAKKRGDDAKAESYFQQAKDLKGEGAETP